MRRFDCGLSGGTATGPLQDWRDLRLADPWPRVVEVVGAGGAPRKIQCVALGEQRLLDHRRNVIVAAPTNGGKSLVGLLALLEAVRRGQRAVLLEPLRAIAREKYDEIREMGGPLGLALGRAFAVRITTGDYRLDHEAFNSPPPDRGELIIATPERFDAILRNPANAAWVGTIGCVCVDEAHLISTPRRGLTLEYVLTALGSSPAPPRLVLLSASLGGLGRAQAWLSPCDVARVTERWPPLRKEVWELAAEDGAADRAVSGYAEEALADPSAQLLVFVYQTRSAERLAAELRNTLGARAGCDGPLPFHAQLPPSRREEARQAFLAGRSRCLVSTTALGLGVNLPATHVVVRDTTFPGNGALGVADVLQMMGRAGRGDRAGHAVALVRAQDGWAADELAAALRDERLPDLASALDHPGRGGRSRSGRTELVSAATAAPVLAHLSRHGEQGLAADEVRAFFARSLGGATMAGQVGALLAWLCEPSRCLVYRDEQGRYRPTVLGRRTAETMLPLEAASGAAQLVRDLLSSDEKDQFLAAWRPLDHLILLELLVPHSQLGRRFGRQLAEQVDGWVEGHPAWGALLYREWIRGAPGASRASELLGSLGVEAGGQGAEAGAREAAYLAVFRAVLLVERASGRDTPDIERRWGVSGLEGAEGRWRDDALWLLSAWARILEVRCFYYHLREACSADDDRVRRVEGLFRQMRSGIFDLCEQLRYCSPLGPMLRSLRRTRASPEGGSVGVQTIRRLEGAGVRSVADLAGMSVDDLVALQIRRSLAQQICGYVRRRLA